MGIREAIASRADDHAGAPARLPPLAAHLARASGARSRTPDRRGAGPCRPRGAAARSRTAGWSCLHATRSCAPRSSASSTSHPPARRRASWPRTSPRCSAKWSGSSRRWRPPGGSRPRPLSGLAVGRVAGIAVHRMAKRFIVGQGPGEAVPALARLWRAGAAASVDLLGEATVTAAEADRYAARCDEALRTLAAAAAVAWNPTRARQHGRHPEGEPQREGERDDAARARRRAGAGRRRRRRTPARAAAHGPRGRRAPAHRHGVDGHARADHRARHRAAVRARVPRRPVRRHRPAGLPARRRRGAANACSTGPPTRSRQFTIRLVKGAYWEHETVEARQHGWIAAGVRGQGRQRPLVRAPDARCSTRGRVIARRSPRHNLRSTRPRARPSAPDTDLELQVLRGLGDDLQDALAGSACASARTARSAISWRA